MFLGSIMRTAIFLVAIFCLTSCACVAKPSAAPYDTVHAGKGVTITFWRDVAEPGSTAQWYDVLVTFEQREDYDALAQEIEFESGEFLIEVFVVAKGCRVVDHHRGMGWRRCKVYPVNIVGVDLRDGWGHLPCTQDGSRRTTVGPNFNATYQATHETRGCITRQAIEDAATWRITPDKETGALEVWTPGGISLFTSAP